MKHLGVYSILLAAVAWPAAAAETVSYASWGGAYQEGVRNAIFTHLPADHDLTVQEYTLTTGLGDLRKNVSANANPIDVAELYGGLCDRAAEEGLLVPLDYSKIPNAAGVPENLRGKYWIGFTAYPSVLAWNTKTYGDNPPKGWADFFDVEKFPGTRATGGTAAQTNLEIALLADGVPKEKMYPLDVDRAVAKWEAFKPNLTVRWTSGAQATQLATAEEADMLVIWGARIDAAIKDGAPYKYSYDNAVLDVECLLVPKASPNPEGAMRLINHMLDPKYQANLPQFISYAPMNQDAFKLLSPDVAARLPTSAENLSKMLVIDMPFWAKHEAEYQEKWDKAMQ